MLLVAARDEPLCRSSSSRSARSTRPPPHGGVSSWTRVSPTSSRTPGGSGIPPSRSWRRRSTSATSCLQRTSRMPTTSAPSRVAPGSPSGLASSPSMPLAALHRVQKAHTERIASLEQQAAQLQWRRAAALHDPITPWNDPSVPSPAPHGPVHTGRSTALSDLDAMLLVAARAHGPSPSSGLRGMHTPSTPDHPPPPSD